MHRIVRGTDAVIKRLALDGDKLAAERRDQAPDTADMTKAACGSQESHPYLRNSSGHPLVLVMEATEHGLGNDVREVYVYLNNDVYGYAVANAKTLSSCGVAKCHPYPDE